MKSPFWIICSDAPVQLTRSCKHTARQFAARISLARLFRLASDKGDRSRLDRCLPRQSFDKKRFWNHEHAMLDLPTAKSCPVHFAKLNLSKLTHPFVSWQHSAHTRYVIIRQRVAPCLRLWAECRILPTDETVANFYLSKHEALICVCKMFPVFDSSFSALTPVAATRAQLCC